MKKITSSKECLSLKCCCVFEKDEKFIAPYLSLNEIGSIDKRLLVKRGNFLFQVKVVKSDKQKGKCKCVFLDEKEHKCLIYKNRPLECQIWPFILGKDKDGKGVYLWIADNEACPATTGLKKKDLEYFSEGIIRKLKKEGVLKEIKDGKRYIWQYLDYHKKVKNLGKLIK